MARYGLQAGVANEFDVVISTIPSLPADTTFTGASNTFNNTLNTGRLLDITSTSGISLRFPSDKGC